MTYSGTGTPDTLMSSQQTQASGPTADTASASLVESSNSDARQVQPPKPPAVGQPAAALEDKQMAVRQADNESDSNTVAKAHPEPHAEKSSSIVIPEEKNATVLPMKNNSLYNVQAILEKLSEYPVLRIRGEGKYYLSMKNVVVEKHQKLKPKNRRGQVIPIIHREVLGPIESVVRRFCEEVMSISRATILPLSSQGERHMIWVGRLKAKHIIKFIKGNGCYIVNRFPGDVFLKDKQVMGVTLRQFMLERKNRCFWKCGAPKDNFFDEEDADDKSDEITYRICQHMVRSMRTNANGCTDEACYNYGKKVCKHFDIFIPEVQSFCLYNALQDFSNRLSDDLKGQMFICKPSYLYKGLGFRFFNRSAEFEEFYHMTIGKETSRHDFLVQRVVKDPYLFNGRKVDIRAFLLIVTLRHRRVLAFVNPGFCRIASAEYDQAHSSEDADAGASSDDQLTPRQMREKRAEELELNMQMLVCPHITAAERADRAKRTAEHRLFTDAEDRSKELDEVFRSESLLQRIKKQICHIGMRLASAIERKIWDAYGCYQIFGMDLCVDESYKVWLLEVNSHAMSEVDLLSPTQRVVVPAVMMEALGLVMECMYKSSHGYRLRKSPYDEFKETGFLFSQHFQMVFSTLARRRTNYVHPRPPKDNGPPFYERIATVDDSIQRTARRRRACDEMKQRVHDQLASLKKRRSEKKEEES